MATAELLLSFESAAALREDYEANLRHGRAFIAGARGVERLAPCTLRLKRVDTDESFTVPARVILVSEQEPLRGVAVEIVPGPWREQLTLFVEGATASDDEPDWAVPAHEDRETDENSDSDHDDHGVPHTSAYLERRRELRHMSVAERARVAQGSNIDDRVLLERIFGRVVWEMLLHSSTITPPEVATIARKGSLPIPLIEVVIDNTRWMRHEIVRRSLLNNARTPPHCIMKVLQATPRSELKMILEGAISYPPKVRSLLQTLKGRRS